jgi:C4-dicarboxylate-specific signal transduction histidine kinase
VSERADSPIPDDVRTVYSSIYHEIANIITPASLYITMARRANADPEIDKMMAGAGKQIDHLQDILKRFREFYRPPEPALEKTPLELVVNSALADVEASAGDGFARPRLEGLDAEVHVDPQGLKRVMTEVLANGWEAISSADDKTWSVSAERDDGATVVRVVDGGAGVASDVVPDPFAPFSSTKSVRGSGLGLPIARAIMTTFGGEIDIAAGVDGGTTVSLRLPNA